MEHEILVKSGHGVSQNTFHLIWTTKYRYPTFRSQLMREFGEVAIRKAATTHDIEIFEMRLLPDHVHMFARLPKSMPVTKAFQFLKGGSSFHIRKYMPWLKKYKAVWSSFAFSRTVGEVTGNVIEHYIKESNTKGQYGSQTSLRQF